LALERLYELLLTGDPVEVGVGVPVTHVVEGLATGQLLVAGLQVDRRIPAGTAVRVEVVTVDIEPDPTHPVHDLAEAPEVDRDQVVDRDAREGLDGLERALRPAVRVRLVDPTDVRRHAR